MTLEEIMIRIQDFFDENTLTIVGSGLSCAEGIPGMSGLADELKSKVPAFIKSADSKDNWNFIVELLDLGQGLEQALQKDVTEELIETVQRITANFIRKAETTVLNDIVRSGKTLRFSEYIKRFNIRNEGLTVITTNYDRLIEYSCEQLGIRIDTLFVGRFLSYFDPEESKNSFCKTVHRAKGGKIRYEYAPRVKVLKPHGCLSWYRIDGQPFSIPYENGDDCLIITPGSGKYRLGYNAPFDTHREQANRAIDNAQQYIIIGYGFADEHLETHLQEQIKTKNVLIVTHTLSDQAYRLCKTYDKIIALTCKVDKGVQGSLVITKDDELFVPNVNLWDIREMTKEVFQ